MRRLGEITAFSLAIIGSVIDKNQQPLSGAVARIRQQNPKQYNEFSDDVAAVNQDEAESGRDMCPCTECKGIHASGHWFNSAGKGILTPCVRLIGKTYRQVLKRIIGIARTLAGAHSFANDKLIDAPQVLTLLLRHAQTIYLRKYAKNSSGGDRRSSSVVRPSEERDLNLLLHIFSNVLSATPRQLERIPKETISFCLCALENEDEPVGNRVEASYALANAIESCDTEQILVLKRKQVTHRILGMAKSPDKLPEKLRQIVNDACAAIRRKLQPNQNLES